MAYTPGPSPAQREKGAWRRGAPLLSYISGPVIPAKAGTYPIHDSPPYAGISPPLPPRRERGGLARGRAAYSMSVNGSICGMTLTNLPSCTWPMETGAQASPPES